MKSGGQFSLVAVIDRASRRTVFSGLHPARFSLLFHYLWLILAAQIPASAAVLLQDTFDCAGVNPNTADVNFEISQRQSGVFAPLTYTKAYDAVFSQIGNSGAPNQLLLAGRAGGSGGAVSLDYGFVDPPLPGGRFVIEFDVNPVLRAAGFNETQTAWVAVTFGSGSASRNRYPQLVDGIGLLFRGNRQFQAFSAGQEIGTGNFAPAPDQVMHHILVALAALDGGNPFDGTSPVSVQAFADNAPTPFLSYIRTNGFQDNYISLIGEGEGGGGDGVVRHAVDNMSISLAPAPNSVFPWSPALTNPANGHLYVLLTTGTWADSEAEAVTLGGHLATIRNSSEEDWVYSTFGGYSGAARLLWLGLNDAAQAGRFVWSSGEPVTYTRFACGEPNNAGGDEHYVAIYYPGHSEGGEWNDWADRTVDPIGVPFNGVVEFIPAPQVTVAPQVLYPGMTAHLRAVCISAAPLAFQWLRNGTNLADAGDVSGTGTATLAISNAGAADATDYSVLVTTSAGSLQSPAVSLELVPPPPEDGYAATVLANHPLAYWPLDEQGDPATNAVAFDSAGGFNGVFERGATNGFEGIAGPQPPLFPGFAAGSRAVQTGGGDNSWVRIPAMPLLTTNTVTFAAWVRPAATPADYAGLLMTRGETSAGFGFTTDGQFGYTWNTNTTWAFLSGLTLPTNQWSLVAAVIEPARATLYLGTQGTLSSVVNPIAHGTEAWGGLAELGSDPWCNSSRTFMGEIANAALFDHALSAEQVHQLYTAAVSPPVHVSAQWTGSGLILSWPRGTLLEADGLGGPWNPVPGATPPYAVDTAAPRKFFRVMY